MPNRLNIFFKLRIKFTIALLILSSIVFSQTTINLEDQNGIKSEIKNSAKHKVMLIPFENRMYMSEIDHVINAETQKTQKEIRWSFKDKIDQVLYSKFKAKYDVVSLVEDTIKSRHDLAMIYKGIGFKFDRVPNQENYEAPKSDYQREGKIKNGQINIAPDYSKRFMNAKLQDKNLLQKLNTKYKSDIFVFINQLDLKGSNTSSNNFGSEKTRTALIHYTVFNLEGKEISSGIADCIFPKNQNDPDKITHSHIEKALEIIYQRVDKVMNTPTSTINKK